MNEHYESIYFLGWVFISLIGLGLVVVIVVATNTTIREIARDEIRTFLKHQNLYYKYEEKGAENEKQSPGLKKRTEYDTE